MIALTGKQKVSKVLDEVKTTSFSERREIKSEEEIINSFLDKIIDFKKNVATRTQKIEDISEKMETISWINEKMDDETLKDLNNLIVLAKDLHKTLIIHYVSFTPLRKNGIAKEETANFKNALDTFKEVYSDIESTFFSLPNNKDFVEITKRISA